MAGFSPRDVAFSKILYMVPAETGDVINDDILSGQDSLDGVNTEGADGVLTIDYTGNSNNATAAGTRVAGTYTIDVDADLTDAQDGTGTGLVLAITVNADRSLAAAVVVNGGKGYDTTDVITVPGTLLGGTAPAGNATLSPNAPLATAGNATGVSGTKRHFIPVNAPAVEEYDYGTDAEDLSAQRRECQMLIGENRDSDDAAAVADEQIAFTVHGVQ